MFRHVFSLLIGSVCGLTFFAWGAPAGCQTIPAAESAGCLPEPRLPMVPLKQPRPAEGTLPDQRWRTSPEGADAAPTASLVDGLRGNDAAFEVIVGQGRLLTLKTDIATKRGGGVIAVGDPTVADFDILPNPRMIRVMGKRAGVTDLSIMDVAGQSCNFEVHVVYDLPLLTAQLRQLFPDAEIRLAQLREHLVVEGEARSPAQVTQILSSLQAYLEAVQASPATAGQGVGFGAASGGANPLRMPPSPPAPGEDQASIQPSAPMNGTAYAAAEGAGPAAAAAPRGSVQPRIINLLRVPGVHQVSLQVQIAELNRTAIRKIGADLLFIDPKHGNIFGTQAAGLGILGLAGLGGAGQGGISPNAAAFGVFPSADFKFLIRALRENKLLSILAEPNLVTMSGSRASFLAGGEFPVPVPQSSGGLTSSITVVWKEFGVKLDFLPYVMEDGTIRLSVTPEVSTIDFALGTTLVQGGDPVPGINARRANTTVQLRQGETLAIAGLLQVQIDADTARIPGLGDLPYIGPFFSNTSHQRIEKELLVLVTPYLVAPMGPGQVPPMPNEGLTDPNDLEFYLLNRIEGRTGRDVPATKTWDDPWHFVRLLKLERSCVAGPVGFSDSP